MKVVTLVPLRLGNDARRWWCWDQTKPFLEDLGYPIFTGDKPGEWNRSGSINLASRAAGDWDVALIGDGDTIPDKISIQRAVQWVGIGGGAARPHLERIMLNAQGSLQFLRRGPSSVSSQHLDKQYPGGGLIVVRRDAFDLVKGYDERFIEWGHEDSWFNLSVLMTTQWERLPGQSWHLWHPRHATGARNESRRLYQGALRQSRPRIQTWAKERHLDAAYAEQLF